MAYRRPPPGGRPAKKATPIRRTGGAPSSAIPPRGGAPARGGPPSSSGPSRGGPPSSGGYSRGGPPSSGGPSRGGPSAGSRPGGFRGGPPSSGGASRGGPPTSSGPSRGGPPSSGSKFGGGRPAPSSRSSAPKKVSPSGDRPPSYRSSAPKKVSPTGGRPAPSSRSSAPKKMSPTGGRAPPGGRPAPGKFGGGPTGGRPAPSSKFGSATGGRPAPGKFGGAPTGGRPAPGKFGGGATGGRPAPGGKRSSGPVSRPMVGASTTSKATAGAASAKVTPKPKAKTGSVAKSGAAATLSAHLTAKKGPPPPEYMMDASGSKKSAGAAPSSSKTASVVPRPAVGRPGVGRRDEQKTGGGGMRKMDSAAPKVDLSYASCAEAVEGFLSSERTYVESLRSGFLTFLKRLRIHVKHKRVIINSEKIDALFGSYFTILNANEGLFKDLNALRMRGLNDLKMGVGRVMVDFIPYLRVYTDYIVKKGQRIETLEKLKSDSKKFREFVKINEAVIDKKLKKVLQEPNTRLAMYAAGLGAIYTQWAKEVGTDAMKQSEEAQLLRKAITDVAAVMDEIAFKCKDTKARRDLGHLQRTVFGDRIMLIASHRLCIKWADVKMVKKTTMLTDIVLILCNDILVIGTRGSRFKAGQMVAAFPLIGLRAVMSPTVDPQIVSDHPTNAEFRFAIIPQNTKFSPTESAGLGSIIAVLNNEKDLRSWVRHIEDSVEEEEHNPRPTNPVELEKRLRKERTTPEGANDKIQITDPEKLRAIDEWKAARGSSGPIRRMPTSGGSAGLGLGSRGAPVASAMGGGGARPAPAMGGGGGMTSRPSPFGGGGGGGKKKMQGSGTASLISGMMSAGGPRLQAVDRTTSPGRLEPEKADTRTSLMAGIAGFQKKGLKKTEGTESATSSRPLPSSQTSSAAPDMADLLQSTLANYRAYVQDEEDSDDDSGSDWE